MIANRFLFRPVLLTAVFLLILCNSGSAQKIWTLEDCINYALENNLDINKQLLTVETNRAGLLESGLNMLPNLNAGGNNTWNFGQTIDQYTNTFATNTVRSNNFYISSNVAIYSGLQKFNTFKANQINLLASKFDLDRLKNSISLTVAGFYLDILFNRELLDIAQEQLRITMTQVDRMQKLVDAGSAARGDLLNIEAQKAGEELAVVEAKNRLYISYLSLQQLIDFPVAPDFQIEKPNLKAVQPPKEKITAEIIFEHAVKSRPEIKSAELRVELAQKQLAIARGYVQPTLLLGGSWGTGYSGVAREIDPNVPSVTKMEPIGITQISRDTVLMPQTSYNYRLKSFGDQLKTNNNQSVGFTLNIPIFNGWSGRTRIYKAKIQKSQAELDLGITTRDLRKLIEQSYADAVAALQKYNASGDQVKARTEAFKYAQQKFDVGVMTAFDYNTSKKDLTKSESDLLQAKFSFIFKTTILDFYMGNPIKIDRE
ncbi:MAG: TolC family protein [Bacteroidetes bacterium]|nr:TolC family protein [Bacteroidota bacterium]